MKPRRITWQGETLITEQWSLRTGLAARRILERLRHGWTVERALTQPLRRHRYPRHPRRSRPAIDLRGQRFGRLVVLQRDPGVGRRNAGGNRTFWRCRCDCGVEVVVCRSDLRSHTRSCGCLIREENQRRARRVPR